jgi:PAS domain S-box-containing protein
MLLIDPGDAGILDANERAASFYGWTREELCRMTVSDINTMSEEEIAREMERARRESRTYFEMQHRLRDGSVRDVAVFSGSVVIGGEERLFSVVRDLTEQKQAAKELYVLRYATENSAWGVFRIRESDGRILYANRFARETLGYTADEITELTVFEIDPNFTPEGWAAHRRDVREAVGTTIETSHRRKDGSEFPVEMTNTFISYEDEVFFFAFARDISARKRAEERLHASLREKEVLLREVHHRVKNNLAVIAGLIRLQLHEAEPDDASAEALSKTRDRITVMSLMHNMLYHEQNVARVDMADLVARIANQLQDFYDPHFRISVAYDLADAAVELGDALPIGLITNEVLTNALIHAFPGGDAAAGPETPRISVRLRTDGSAANTGTGERSPAAAGNPGTGRPTAELTIADNGRGLPEDFDPERRNSLGFRMIFLLAEQVGGEIRIDRSDGTRVTLAVPL